MKISLGFRVVEGPWGGGNRFVRTLAAALERRGDVVVYSLDADDIDIILILDPRWRHPSVTFTTGAVLRYMLWSNPRAIVVHRVNECDERKNTKTLNHRLRIANYCADHTVFVGSWLRNLGVWRKESESSVILNGADNSLFHPGDRRVQGATSPFSLVTHHWGGNWMKGFDIYRRLDEMLVEDGWKDRIGFTYIGNLPKGFVFRNARYVEPLDGAYLAAELRRHHAYVTASINEPGGNHQNEGALCGLPLLYRRSGCLPEYCDGYGVAFDETDFEEALTRLIGDYERYAVAVTNYPHTAELTCARYLDLFDELLESRERILASRRLWRNPWLLLRNQLPI